MPTLISRKQLLRKDITEKLLKMSPEEQHRQSTILTDKLLSMQIFRKSQRVSIYLSRNRTEISTDRLVETIISSGRQCFVPYCHQKQMSMVPLISLKEFRSLPLNRWGIREPPANLSVLEEYSGSFDLIVIPGLAFDRCGNRLGHGGGYYDRFLQRIYTVDGDVRVVPSTVALAFHLQIVENVPIFEHDIKVDRVLYTDGL